LENFQILARQDQAGRNFAQRQQHESPLVSARVWQRQPRRITRFLPKTYQVEVEEARFVKHRLWPPTKLLL
jgi:hypothetical protein